VGARPPAPPASARRFAASRHSPHPPAQTELVTLNLCKNKISRVEGLSTLQKLSTLLLGHNELHTVEDVAPLAALPLLSCLDLQENRLDDPAVLDTLRAIPSLAVLYLQGNPVVKKLRHYRKQVVARLPGLKYLDDRPVFPDERRRCDAWYAAWLAGGDAAATAAERAEIDAIAAEKKEEEDRNFAAFAEFARRAAAGDPAPWEALQRGGEGEASGDGGGSGGGGGGSGGGGGGSGGAAAADEKKSEEELDGNEGEGEGEEEEEKEEGAGEERGPEGARGAGPAVWGQPPGSPSIAEVAARDALLARVVEAAAAYVPLQTTDVDKLE
jgi:hypothetical protein